MGTCHPMTTLKHVDSVTSFPVDIKLRYKLNREYLPRTVALSMKMETPANLNPSEIKIQFAVEHLVGNRFQIMLLSHEI